MILALIAAALLPACLADAPNLTTNTTQGADKHRASADYYAVSQLAYAWWVPGTVAGSAAAVDHQVEFTLGAAVSQDSLLQIASANHADWADNIGISKYGWYALDNSTFNAKSFIHKTRCNNGKTGVTVQSGSTSYKKCDGIFSTLTIGKIFNQPAYLCEETCDKDPLCTAYSTASDSKTDVCWILYMTHVGGISTYFRISD
jgi:hypothetical protein